MSNGGRLENSRLSDVVGHETLATQQTAVTTRKGLAKEARKARVEAGLSQLEVAERLDVDRSAISKAENWQKGDGFTSLRKRIIKEVTGKDVRGPLYEVGYDIS